MMQNKLIKYKYIVLNILSYFNLSFCKRIIFNLSLYLYSYQYHYLRMVFNMHIRLMIFKSFVSSLSLKYKKKKINSH